MSKTTIEIDLPDLDQIAARHARDRETPSLRSAAVKAALCDYNLALATALSACRDRLNEMAVQRLLGGDPRYTIEIEDVADTDGKATKRVVGFLYRVTDISTGHVMASGNVAGEGSVIDALANAVEAIRDKIGSDHARAA